MFQQAGRVDFAAGQEATRWQSARHHVPGMMKFFLFQRNRNLLHQSVAQALNIGPMDQTSLDTALSQNLEKKNINGSLFKFDGPINSEPSELTFKFQ